MDLGVVCSHYLFYGGEVMEIIGGTFLLLIVIAAWLQIPEEDPDTVIARARYGKI